MQHRLCFAPLNGLILLVSACVLALPMPASAQDKVLRWHDNLDRAAQASRESGKPLFVVFRCVR
ncbi:MAG: hypothetical protein HY290_16730 [Planctomycetia bacterium]|nr:hypothetical protein [Planctomycetia bacterium]